MVVPAKEVSPSPARRFSATWSNTNNSPTRSNSESTGSPLRFPKLTASWTEEKAEEVKQSTASLNSSTNNSAANEIDTTKSKLLDASVSQFERMQKYRVMVFHPRTGEFNIEEQFDEFTPTDEKYESEFKALGIVGVLDLGFSKTLFYVQKRKVAASLGPHRTIYQCLRGGNILVYRQSYLTLEQEFLERESVDHCMEMLNCGLLYFSYGYDVTKSTQSLLNVEEGVGFEAEDPNPHTWNWNLMKPFMLHNPACAQFILPMFCGYVGHLPACLPLLVTDTYATEADVDIVLIARMHRRRAGTRYTRRGIDKDGYAAVSVQTELLVSRQLKRGKSLVASFVMIRGSVPYFWTQNLLSSMPYKPPVVVEPISEDGDMGFLSAVQSHIRRLQISYGSPISCISLLDGVGFEAPLQQTYSKVAEIINRNEATVIDYKHFDLNDKATRKLALSQIDAHIRPLMDAQSHFSAKTDDKEALKRATPLSTPFTATPETMTTSYFSTHGSNFGGVDILSRQNGVFRVNCLDCLDRTNMVQYIIGSRSLIILLNSIGINTDTGKVLDHTQRCEVIVQNAIGRRGLNLFRKMWVDHGDSIARQCKPLKIYFFNSVDTGTGALNSIFISTGKWYQSHLRIDYQRHSHLATVKHLLRDGMRATGRFYLNYFVDSLRQDALDVFLGYHRGTGTLSFDIYQRSITDDAANVHKCVSAMISIQKVQERELSKNGWLTAYILLLQRFAFPQHLDKWWEWILMLVWMYVWSVWTWAWHYTRGDQAWQGSNWVRVPKSSRKCWLGDEHLIVVPMLDERKKQ